MKRPLVWIAAGGFALSVFFFVGAAALSDGDDWSWRHGDFMDHGWGEREDRSPQDKTIVERELTWSADDEISINAPAKVTYSYAEKPRVTVRGPAYVVNRLEMDDGEINLNRHMRNSGKLEITIAGPAIKKFAVRGAAQLTLKDLKQDELEVSVAGAGQITANGEVRKVDISIAGASEVDFTELKVEDAKVSISGIGDVRIAPTNKADVSIAGAGDVKLLTRPKSLSSHIAGAGNISQPDEQEETAAAPAATKPPAPPAAVKGK